MITVPSGGWGLVSLTLGMQCTLGVGDPGYVVPWEV